MAPPPQEEPPSEKPEFFSGPGGRTLAHQSLTCFEGHLPVILDPLPVAEMDFHWKGVPIPFETWRVITAFLKWSYDEYSCEAQCRLCYNIEKQEWRVAVLPQHISAGLFTKEIEDDDDRETAFEECGLYTGFDFVGTVHHHCSTGAFQSGTDHKDELTQPGYHVTLGHLSRKTADFHSRGSFRGVMYPTVTNSEWLPYDEEKLRSLEDLPPFPEQWKTRLKKAPTPVYGTHTGSYWNVSQGAYLGLGEGRPPTLPACVVKKADRPYYLATREFFWDYMIAAFDCASEPDMHTTPSFPSLESAGWKSACNEALIYSKFVESQPYMHRKQVNVIMFELIMLEQIKISATRNRWYHKPGGLGFSPQTMADTIVKNGAVLGISLDNATGPTVKKALENKTEEQLIIDQIEQDPSQPAKQQPAPWYNQGCKACSTNPIKGLTYDKSLGCAACVKQSGIRPEGYMRRTSPTGLITWVTKEAALEEARAAQAIKTDAAKKVAEKAAAALKQDQNNALEREAARFDFLENLEFDDLVSALPTPPSLSNADLQFAHFMEELFEESCFVEALQSVLEIACGSASDVLFDGFKGRQLPSSQANKDAEEVARILLVGMRYSIEARQKMESLLQSSKVIALDMDSNTIDMLFLGIASAFERLSNAELKELSECKILGFLKLRNWVADHLLDLLVKTNMDQK